MAETEKITPAPPSRGALMRKVVFAGLASIVSLAPLPLGSGRPLAWDAIGMAVAVLLAMSCGIEGIKPRLWRDIRSPLALFTIVALYVILQVAPWVPSALRNPVWDMASEALGHRLSGGIAVDPGAALIDLFRLSFYAATCYLAVVLCQEPENARALIKVVAWSGSAYALYALIVYWSGNTMLLWFPKWAYFGDLTGTFVNRNNFATYLGLCLLAALGELVDTLEKVRLRGTRRQKLDDAIGFLSSRTRSLLCAFALATALLLTHSRGGFIATVLGVFALLFAIFFLSKAFARSRSLKIGVVSVAVVLVFAAFLISGGMTMARLLGTDVNTEERLAVYQITLQAIRDYPVFGTGFGSFASVFPIYKTAAISSYYDMAHNDYLQNILELGLPIATCLFLAVAWLAALCVRGIRIRRRDAIYPCVGLAATVLVAFHSTVDFSLQIPAVTVTYMWLLGAGVAQSRSSREI